QRSALGPSLSRCGRGLRAVAPPMLFLRRHCRQRSILSEAKNRKMKGAAMAIGASGRLATPHDWHSDQYVADWVIHDTARDPERRPRLQQMLKAARLPREAEIAVLDVGAGYGAVTEEVLKAFPKARITLQDYSQPMLAEAKRRLAVQAAQLRYVTSDLTDPA